MKRAIILLLALVLTISLVACGTVKPSDETTTTTKPQSTTTTTTTSTTEQTSSEPAKVVNLEEIANALVKTDGIEFSPMVSEVEVGTEWMTGFNTPVTGFSECWQFAPMIGVMPFVGYVFNVADGGDVEAFKTQLKTNSKLNWNICTSANTTICENNGNIVLFVMLSIENGEEDGLPTGIDKAIIANFNQQVNG